ncbi:tetratricopeptide repeat protein [Ketobacter sp.]|uniref:tetratricopeptide repeat protein n=1 Tax=Ketobacter sp. TaxID=2083498 RepID=UPI000F19A851|nr:tetratricopeptide repeat protein [Ketobacter sp.]RLU01933.1 MAG: tetratricopeptide repeat protein [Ketobacter sp.]
MNYTKPLICALLVSALSAPVYAAKPSSWGESDALGGVSKKIDAQQYDAAILDLEKIVAKDADNADAYNLLGFSNRKLKHYEVAEKYYLRALTLNPKHKGAMEYLGELYVETNRLDQARDMLTRLDEACFFGCKEYRELKAVIEQKEQKLEVSAN